MLTALVINLVYAKAIGVTMGAMAREVGADMWVASVFATIQGAALMLITVVLLRRMPSGDIIDVSDVMLGKWAAKLVALLIFAFFIMAFGTVMMTLVYHLKDYFLPDAPTFLFVLVGSIVGIYGCYAGLEVMGRMALFGVTSILLLNILLIFGSLHEFDVRNLMPLLDNGIVKTVWASRQNDTDWAMATMMAAMVLPHVTEPKDWGRSAPAGILMGGLIVLMWPILEAGVLSAPVTGEYIVACMQMARSAHIGQFIHRYEMIMVALFSMSALIQVMICLFCATHAVSKVFGLKDYRRLLIPVGIIMGAFGYWIVRDHFIAMDFTTRIWPLIGLPIAIGLPLILLALSFFLGQRRVDRSGKS